MIALKFVFIILEVLLLFNLLIAVHELGHFLAARWRGLKIERFAIWFGKPIWKKKIGGVEYALCSIPAGGYVSLPQMASMEAIEGKSESSEQPLPAISPLDKIIVAAAGPLFSFLLALVFAVVVMVVGRPVSEAETTTVIGWTEKDGPADKAGLRAGDKILSVDGQRVTKFAGMGDSVTWRIVRSTGETIPIEVEREGRLLTFHPTPVKDPTGVLQRKSLRQIKILPAESALIAEVKPDSPAAQAGLQVGDQVLSVQGVKLYHYAAFADYMDEHSGQPLQLQIKRADKTFTVSITPEKPLGPPDAKPRIGLVWNGNGRTFLAHPNAIEQVYSSVTGMVDTFGALFAKKSDIKVQHLGGAVKIIEVYYRLIDSENGWRQALWFSVLMNVNLAFLNILPIPVLDGGHVLLALIEAIRRKPVSAKVLNYMQTAFACALIFFMVYLAFYDVQDLPWNRSKDKPADMQFAPKAPDKH